MAVPAWKKLGLKLKQSAAASEAPPAPSHPQQPRPPKRRPDAPPADAQSKKPRTQTKPSKAVSFHEPAPAAPSPPKQQAAAAAPASIAPALDYLRRWHTARAAWKFNKNHQATLIRHVFDPQLLPAADAPAFYAYVRDLQGFTRTRLRDAAAELRAKDSASGAAGFPEGTARLADRQLAYEAALARVLHAPAGRLVFDEERYGAEEEDEEVRRRVVRRMRAQLVMDALADEAPAPTTTTTTTTTTTVVTDLTRGDGAGKRRRKLRVNEDSSDSSTSEESDSDTSDSSSEEEEDKAASSSTSSDEDSSDED